MSLLETRDVMKKLNNRGLSIVEVVVTFAIVMAIISGLLAIIMNYRQKAETSFSELELETLKNTLTKTIQDDILNFGISEINHGGSCMSSTSSSRFSACANLVFKNGTQKILGISKIDQDNRNSIENKYIFYDDEKYVLKDNLPKNIPEGRHAYDFQTIFVSTENFLSSDRTILSDGTEIKIYSIDIAIEHIEYEQDFGLHIVATDFDLLTANAMRNDFSYTGNFQEFTAPADGTYQIELWGASGGNIGPYVGGKGAYTSGYIALKKNQTLFVYVGGSGEREENPGYNGGGSIAPGNEEFGSIGGGATDVRLVDGPWDDFDSLKSRIMVAGGGGGANYRNVTSEEESKLYGSGHGGSAGGLFGYDGDSESFQAPREGSYKSANFHAIGGGGTQVLGGTKKGYNNDLELLSSAITGGFGLGTNPEQSAGGGGWYTGSQSSSGGAGGGSSYISGHLGCQAINQNSTSNSISHKANSEYDSYVFSNTLMIDGEGFVWNSTTKPTERRSMPNNGITTIEGGNVGDGHARITYLGL